MRIIAAMLVKNEDWCLRATIPAALEWCEEVVLLDDFSTDDTAEIAMSFDRVHYHCRAPRGAMWDEMEARQELADLVMPLKPDVFGLVDADELLPVPFRRDIRVMLEHLPPDTCLCPASLNPWNCLTDYRIDRCQWTTMWWSTAIKVGNVPLVWKSAKDGYTHHHRVPDGITETGVKGPGVGTIHLQFANLPRRKAKHDWYMMTELLRWGRAGRRQSSVGALNQKYGKAFDEKGLLTAQIPDYWFRQSELDNIDISSPGWYIDANRQLVAEHGKAAFAGLNLHFMEEYL